MGIKNWLNMFFGGEDSTEEEDNVEMPTPAKKTPAKKPSVKKAPVKKAPAKKAPAKKKK
jgi:hypothetical protein